MRRTVTMAICGWFSCLFLNFSALQAQELIRALSLSEQVTLSQQVVEGEVLTSESFWDASRQHIYTMHHIKVFKVFKGQALTDIQVITRGGVVGLEAEVVSNSLQLKPGEIGLFALVETPEIAANTNAFKPLSQCQSFYKYSLEEDKVANTFNLYSQREAQFYPMVETASGKAFEKLQELPVVSTLSMSRSGQSALAITSFSNSNTTAGTKTIVTIHGTGFGNTPQSVGFSDANYGGALYYNAMSNQIISWTDTMIEVEIPDRAGTGTVRVINANNETAYSSSNLTIDFAQINLEYNNTAYQTQHIDSDGLGGFTWQMNTNFYSSQAKDAFNRALETWSCQTGINWEVSSSLTTVNTVADDGVNVVTFDTANALPSSILGQCISRYSGCVANGAVQWYVDEMDIVFNSSINWNYSVNPPASNQVDFESVALHELGHGHQLGHVINNTEVMHFSIASNTSLRELNTYDLQGAMDVQNRSNTEAICSQSIMDNSDCLLSVDEMSLNQMVFYPNPVTKGLLNIQVPGSISVQQLTMYDLLGQLVLQKPLSAHTSQLDVSALKSGMYLIQLKTNTGMVYKKILIN